MEYCLRCTEPLKGQTVCPHCGFSGEAPDIPHHLRPGTILHGRYLVGSYIGQGGFGITYMGRDLQRDMRIAIKEYYPSGYANRNNRVSSSITVVDGSTQQFIEHGILRFISEARTLAALDQEPGVVRVYGCFRENQTAYIIMEYLDGWDLRKVLQGRTFTADEIFMLLGPVMNTLEKIHAAGIIHRDISPDNLMLLREGRVKLMDFGSARVVDYTDQKSLSVVLKAGFAPEEQYRSKGKQGPWTDIYALCATIYRCITGITPDDALERCFEDSILWPSDLNVPISPVQEAVLKKGMAVRYTDRFQNIAEMRQALMDPNGTPVFLPGSQVKPPKAPPTPPSVPPKQPKPTNPPKVQKAPKPLVPNNQLSKENQLQVKPAQNPPVRKPRQANLQKSPSAGTLQNVGNLFAGGGLRKVILPVLGVLLILAVVLLFLAL